MPIALKLAVDAADALNELGAFSNRLDAMAEGFDKLNTVTTNFNKKGQQTTSTVKAQISEFETVTQVINKNGQVIRTTYQNNEAAARKAEEAAKKREEAAEKRAEKERIRMDNQSSAFAQQASRLSRNLLQFVEFRAFHAITDGLIEGTKAAKDFQIQLSLIRTISQGDEQQTFGKFGRDVRGVSDASGVDIKDVGKAFYDTTSNQVAKGANVAPFVKQATDLARVLGASLPDAVNVLSAEINSYNLSAADAEKLSAQWFATVDRGRIVLSEVANTIGRVDVLAQNLGVAQEDIKAVLAVTTEKGLKTSDAMTLLTNIMIKLEKPTEATAAFFKSLGVNSGEAAVTMYGFIPLINKMVEAVKSGQIDVSAFFDEIRGRKQFGVFQQSGKEIEDFANKLKDTKTLMKEYRDAVKIRGESPADALNIELNKMSNIFKVDLGQAIVKNIADFVSWAGGIDKAKENFKEYSGYVATGGKLLLAYGVITTGVALKNYALTVSFRALGVAALGAVKVLAPLAAGYYVGTKIFGESKDIEVSAAAISGTVEKVEQLRVAYEKFKASQQGAAADPLASFGESSKQLASGYKSVLELLAGATIANDRYLEGTKVKTKEAVDALKVGFGTYTDIFKDRLSKIRKDITDANEEIKRSAKSTLKFQESLDEILFRRKEEYANDDFGQQKIKLAEQRLAELYTKKNKLFAEGTEESIAEGRKVYDELAQHEDKLFGLKTEYAKKQFQNYLNQHPDQANRPGGNIFAVDTSPLERNLQNLASMRAKDEAEITKQKKEQVATGEKLEQKEEARLRTLEVAIKNYDKLDLFTKDGKLNPDFRTSTGRLDRAKFNKALDESEAAIRQVPGPTFEQRIALEALLVAKRKAAIDEVGAYERQEDLKTSQTQILTQKDRTEKQIEDLKKNRDENLKIQAGLKTSIFNKSEELAGFANAIKTNKGGTLFKGAINNEDAKVLQDLINQYTEAAKDLYDNPIIKDGIPILDPKKAQKAYDIYSDVLANFDNMAKKYGLGSTPALTVEGGTKLGPDTAKDAFRSQLDDLKKSGRELYSGVDLEKENRETFKKNVLEPVEKLKAAFPDLKVGAQDFSKAADQSFKDLANGGLEQLREKLQKVNDLLQWQKNPAGIVKPGADVQGALGGDDGGYAYAATGGIVGLFPGQPRGVDRYPIWAAAGERIIDAQTSAMYAPMLDAIMSRRMPQYMAGGGIVGGDTVVGDINITVNGTRTNSDTARVIGQHLERQLRLNNVNLNRRKG
jgi:TP901 family phage tail tape measure protein